MAAGSTRLSNIQALRGVAAVSVLVYHAARHVDKAFGAPELIRIFRSGHAGVDLFFVISGFIILFVHHRDIGDASRLAHYLSRRFNRIFPLYWIALAITVAMSLAGGHRPPALPDLLWSAALLPTVNEPILGIAWTLQFELIFYAAFAVWIANRRVGLALLAAWLAWIAIANAGFVDTGAIPPSLWGIYSVEFLLGMVVARILHLTEVPAPRLWAGAGLALFAAALVLESVGILPGYGVAARLAYGSAAGLLMLGLTTAERAGAMTMPAWLEKLGEASYSIYLFQFVFIGFAWQISLKTGLDRYVSHGMLFLVLSAIALTGGLLMGRLVEKPLLQIMRGGRRTTAFQRA